jgi:hypothetical protein
MELPATLVANVLRLRGVTDMRVVENSSGRALAVRVLSAGGWKRFSGPFIRKKFKLGSTDFTVSALHLDAPPSRNLFGTQVRVTGWVRGLGRARLEQFAHHRWQTVRELHVNRSGRFSVSLAASRSTDLRLAYNELAGEPVALRVTPRVLVQAEGPKLEVFVAPRLPLQVQRFSRRRWQPVARSRGTFAGALGPGNYRVAIQGGASYVSSVTRPIRLHTKQLGP